MTTQEIANRLVELCGKGDFETCYKELYSPQIRSIEQENSGWETVQGFDELAKKGAKWKESIKEFHGQEIGTPIVADNHFALPWTTKVTFTGQNEPVEFSELCVYEVNDGKIVKEQFFYRNKE